MTDPSEDVQEAMYRALLYVEQNPPNPMKPLAILRALQQDGYVVVPEEPSDGTLERWNRVKDMPLLLVNPDRHPFTCEWCHGEWYSYRAYNDHFSSLKHANENHPYLNPAEP